jgi:hypothetical protein
MFIHSHRHVRWQRFYKKNKFELDRPDYENHANRADRYLIRLMAFLLNAKL